MRCHSMASMRHVHLSRRWLAATGAAIALFVGGGVAYAATTSTPTATCTTHPAISQSSTAQTFSVKCSVPLPPQPTVTVTKTVTAPAPTSTTTSTPPPVTTSTPPAPTTTTSAPAPTTTTTAPAPTTTSAPPTSTTWKCTDSLGGGCGAYDYAGIPNSNGYNTYVMDQSVGPQSGTTETLHANSPGDWEIVANDQPYGYTGVQTFPDAQQLFNNWCGTGWTGCSNPTDTPLDSLSALKVTYSETSPTDANSIYEFAPDVWSDGYGADIMFWADTHGRCNEGAFGDTVLGHAVLDGQNWTVHRYGTFGDEVIFVLDGAGGSGTCAQQTSGTIDIKAGLDWLVANGFATGPQTISQLNTGWEITSADKTTFRVTGYGITATPK